MFAGAHLDRVPCPVDRRGTGAERNASDDGVVGRIGQSTSSINAWTVGIGLTSTDVQPPKRQRIALTSAAVQPAAGTVTTAPLKLLAVTLNPAPVRP